MSRKRNLTPEEEQLWRQAMKDIAPLQDSTPFSLDDDHAPKGKATSHSAREWEPPAPKKLARVNPPVIRHPEPQAAKRKSSGAAALEDLNRQETKRVKRGRIEVDGKIDLHGMRQSEAHQELIHRLSDARLRGKRILLVVTGKGSSGKESRNDGSEPFWARGGGVLKQQVPVWLREEPLRSMIFSVQEAHQRHGGGGALYVFLKKVR